MGLGGGWEGGGGCLRMQELSFLLPRAAGLAAQRPYFYNTVKGLGHVIELKYY